FEFIDASFFVRVREPPSGIKLGMYRLFWTTFSRPGTALCFQPAQKTLAGKAKNEKNGRKGNLTHGLPMRLRVISTLMSDHSPKAVTLS
ncbi:MAG: hypothetical protein ACO3TX_13360, partial [Pseudomonadales bacterium]